MHILPLEPSVQCTLSQKQGAEGHKKENWKGWNNAFIGWFSVPCYESKPFQRFLSQIFLKQVRISSEKDWCSHQYPYGGILAQVAAVLLTFMFLLIWSHGQSINQFNSNSVYTVCLYKFGDSEQFLWSHGPNRVRTFSSLIFSKIFMLLLKILDIWQSSYSFQSYNFSYSDSHKNFGGWQGDSELLRFCQMS